MTHPIVQRAFATVGTRQVHYRHAGEGPPVVLLHQSPASSAELEPLIVHLAQQFHVIAPDTPGYGHSDALVAEEMAADGRACIDDYADALAALFDALGLASAAVYGSHTGAIIATRFAVRHPARVHALVANGILFNTSEERAELLAHYFPPFVPDWSGSHLAWLWSRLRDQLVYYPWYQREPERRIEWPMSLADIETAARDLLDAGDHYRGAYRAVLDYDIAPDLPRLSMPSCLMVAQTDALAMYLPQYPAPTERLKVQVLPDFAALPDAVAGYFARWATAAPQRLPLCASVSETSAAAPVSRMLSLAGGQLHLREHTGGNGRPLLYLHDLGSSSQALTPQLACLAAGGPVIAPDLPGHGLSDHFGALSPQAMAEVLRALLQRLDLQTLEVVAEGASAAVARALLAHLPGVRLTLCNPSALAVRELPQLTSHLPPPLAADSAGSHLLRAWTYLKDRDLYRPWSERSAATALSGLPAATPAQLQRDLIDLLRARTVLVPQLEAAWRQATWPVLAASGARVLAVPGHAAHQHLPTALPLPAERSGWRKLRRI